jgi:hypothetical protein
MWYHYFKRNKKKSKSFELKKVMHVVKSVTKKSDETKTP